MAENAILLQRNTPGLERQIAACLPYLDEHGYQLVGWARTHIDVVALVLNGAAKVIVAAASAEDDWQLESLLKEANARFEICRPSPERTSRPGHDTEEIITRMGQRGGTTEEIGRLLGVAEGRVRRILDRIRRNPR